VLALMDSTAKTASPSTAVSAARGAATLAAADGSDQDQAGDAGINPYAGSQKKK
jgi:hypothetical protein